MVYAIKTGYGHIDTAASYLNKEIQSADLQGPCFEITRFATDGHRSLTLVLSVSIGV
jgi:diketogulonate reductase-like aldo/keto reductase